MGDLLTLIFACASVSCFGFSVFAYFTKKANQEMVVGCVIGVAFILVSI